MYVDKLKAAGDVAFYLRAESPTKMTPAYLKAIENIDKEVEILKHLYPNRFHDEGSDEFKALVAKWDADRTIRVAASDLKREIA